MKSAINRITSLNLIFLLILCISGYLQNSLLSDTVYYLAFLIPIAVGAYIIRRDKPITEQLVTVELKIKKSAIHDTLPLIAPTLAAVMITAALTSQLMGLFGYENSMTINESFPLAIIVHALAPALLEELLFRYVPLKMLLPFSKRWAVILSSLYFSLIHANLFQIPYALIAGIFFAIIDIKAESVIPSFIIHFTNNLLSLVTIFANDLPTVQLTVYILVAVAALISLSVIFIRRKSYKDLIRPLFEKGECEELSVAPLLLIITTLILAFSSLF